MIATEYCKNVFDGTHDSPKFLDNGYLLVTSKNIANRELDLTGANFISEEDYNKINERSKVHQWDIFFSMIGTVGNVFLQTEKEVNYAIKNMGVFSCENEDKAKWLYYYLQSPYFKKLMNSLLSGAVQKFVPLGFLRSIDIPKYDDNKKAIVKFLSSLDDKISLNNRINAKLEQMAKRLYEHWFVQFDFPVSCHSELVSESHSEEMLNQVQHDERIKPYKSSGGKMEYNEVLKREIPVGWEVGILSDIANITMGQSPEGSSYNEDGKGTIFYQGSTDFGIRFPTVRMYTTEPTRFAKKGDILMSVRAPVGAVNIANTDCCIGRGLAALNSKIGSITYLWYLMDVFKHTFENKNAAGTTFGSITKDELFNLPVVIPQKEIIFAFNEKTFSIFNYQLSIEKETQKLTALRDRLLPLLMNGQVEVK